jgi:RNA polymerase-binding transcription factor
MSRQRDTRMFTLQARRARLAQDLNTAVSRLRRLNGATALEERPTVAGDNCSFADEVDEIHASESREIDFATRELVLGRVNRLSAALSRMNEGKYGTCIECEEAISLARLDAIPEVQTCVPCQGRLERLAESRPMADDNGD